MSYLKNIDWRDRMQENDYALIHYLAEQHDLRSILQKLRQAGILDGEVWEHWRVVLKQDVINAVEQRLRDYDWSELMDRIENHDWSGLVSKLESLYFKSPKLLKTTKT